jgi:hypothetical protein
MYDRILANGVGLHPYLRRLATAYPDKDGFIGASAESRAHLRSILERPGVIVVAADNVIDYVYAVAPRKTLNIPRDAPNVAPPWATGFVEFAVPPQLTVDPLDGSRRAAFVQSFPSSSLPFTPNTRPPADSMWAQVMTVFAEFAKGDIAVVGTTGWYVRADGTLCTSEAPVYIHGVPILDHFRDTGHATQIAAARECFRHCIQATAYIAALTYSFIHCRNTVLVDHSPDAKLARAAERRGKRLVTYKVLEIEPIKRILAEQGQAEKNGLKQALHICRGHFKDYRGHGLFGKVKGLFWWDMHVRGSASEGVVVKDYTAPAKADEDVA